MFGTRNEVKVGFLASLTPSGGTSPQVGESERRDFRWRDSPRAKSPGGSDLMQA